MWKMPNSFLGRSANAWLARDSNGGLMDEERAVRILRMWWGCMQAVLFVVTVIGAGVAGFFLPWMQ